MNSSHATSLKMLVSSAEAEPDQELGLRHGWERRKSARSVRSGGGWKRDHKATETALDPTVLVQPRLPWASEDLRFYVGFEAFWGGGGCPGPGFVVDCRTEVLNWLRVVYHPPSAGGRFTGRFSRNGSEKAIRLNVGRGRFEKQLSWLRISPWQPPSGSTRWHGEDSLGPHSLAHRSWPKQTLRPRRQD
jgi:hypothetical protein